jgi:hypothetical protein
MDEALPLEEISDRAGGRELHRIVAVFEPGLQLPGSPRRVFLACGDQDFLDLRRGLVGLLVPSSRALFEAWEPFPLESFRPLIGGLPTDAELSAESGDRSMAAL